MLENITTFKSLMIVKNVIMQRHRNRNVRNQGRKGWERKKKVSICDWKKPMGTVIEEKRKGRRGWNHTVFVDFANHPTIPGKVREVFLGELIPRFSMCGTHTAQKLSKTLWTIKSLRNMKKTAGWWNLSRACEGDLTNIMLVWINVLLKYVLKYKTQAIIHCFQGTVHMEKQMRNHENGFSIIFDSCQIRFPICT